VGVFSGVNDVVERGTGTPELSVQAFIEKYRDVYP
jgi:hypothetical protein